MAKARLAVVISGRGSNLQALLDAARAPGYPAQVALVVSNRPGAEGLARADEAGVERLVVDHRNFGKGDAARAGFEAALSAALERAMIDYVCLAGFMRLLTPAFVARWRGRLVNIHPSLLPAFKGVDTHQRMIEAGVKIAGCTVHFVGAETDAGPIIGQAAVPVFPADDATSLAARILEQEHLLYPACMRLIVEKKARLTEAGVVEFDPAVGAGAPTRNPL